MIRYGAQHPIVIHNEATETADYVVVGHCCESGDLFSCAPGDPEALKTRTLSKASIGDLATIEGSGAYCSSMSTKNYNSFPEAAEVLLDQNGEVHLIRRFVNKYGLSYCHDSRSLVADNGRRQTLHQMLENEVKYDPK